MGWKALVEMSKLQKTPKMICLRCQNELTSNEISTARMLFLQLCKKCRTETLGNRIKGKTNKKHALRTQ